MIFGDGDIIMWSSAAPLSSETTVKVSGALCLLKCSHFTKRPDNSWPAVYRLRLSFKRWWEFNTFWPDGVQRHLGRERNSVIP